MTTTCEIGYRIVMSKSMIAPVMTSDFLGLYSSIKPINGRLSTAPIENNAVTKPISKPDAPMDFIYGGRVGISI
jgi:hypothetical protein